MKSATLLIKYISIVTVNDKLINYSEYLLSYISPTVVILSISFLALFATVNIEIKGKRGIVLFSSAAFGVYLIHTNQLVWNYIFHDAFTFIGKMAPLKMFIAIPIIALLIFTAGLFLEIIRIYIFKFLKINLLCEKIEYIMRSLVHLIVRKYIQS